MKAAPMTQKPSFPLMKQGDIQNIYHMQMPRWLFTDPRYMELPLEAKVAYTFLLNRFQLSRLNGWINADGEVFIIYTRKSLAAEMQVSYHKILEAMKSLSAAGLIWERRCGRGEANQIYLAQVEHGEPMGGSAPFVDRDDEAAGARSSETELQEPDAPEDGAHTPAQEVPIQDFLKCENDTSRSAEMEAPEVPDPHRNYTDKREKEISHTDLSQSVRRQDGPAGGESEMLSEILERCELWIFEPEVAQVLENAIERLFYSESFRIGNAVLPRANVRSRMWGLNAMVLQSAVNKMRQNQSRVKNSTAYTMAVIFNAISEEQSDLLVDPYLNSLRDGPAGGGGGCS